MKCPHCGHWNKASLPRCFQCGEPLPTQPDYVKAQGPDWQHELNETAPAKVYIRVDENGKAQAQSDQREDLAKEMADLKARKARGEKHQRKLREESSLRGYAPSSMTVKTNTTRETIFRLKDDPKTTLRPMPPELIEDGEIKEGAIPAYSGSFPRVLGKEADKEDEEGFFPGTQTTSQWVPPSGSDAPPQSVYDGFNDSQAYEPLWSDTLSDDVSQSRIYTALRPSPRRLSRRRLFRITMIVCVAAVVGLFLFAIVAQWQKKQEQARLLMQPTVAASIVNDLAAHTITIPGQDGTQIFVRELSNSYVVSGGVAVIEVPDYIWYNDNLDYLSETMEVTLSPFLRTSSGELKPMDPIPYQIQIPLSPIEMINPDTDRVEVNTAMYAIKLRVREGSTVIINGNDYSDLVNQEGGDVTYNATVQPIGNNNVTITVRSQYCRENTVNITLYRAVQEIPLDLVSDQSSTSSRKTMKITAATIPGAIVDVLTPHSDLDITKTDTDGTFSFNAVFDHIGSNMVTIQAEYEGRQPSVLNFPIYYVPPVDEYSKAAWGLGITGDGPTNYANLLANNAALVKKTQIYVFTGVITEIISNKPQLAIMNTGTEEKPQEVMLENSTRTTWEVGTTYKIFADAFGMYEVMPRLVARYTYDKNGH